MEKKRRENGRKGNNKLLIKNVVVVPVSRREGQNVLGDQPREEWNDVLMA